MGKGFLQVQLYLGYYVSPVKSARVLIRDTNGKILYDLLTDLNGNTQKVPLEAPNITNANSTVPPNAFYTVEVPHFNGLKGVIIHDVQVIDTQTILAPIQMVPAVKGLSPEKNIQEIFVPRVRPVSSCPPGPCNTFQNDISLRIDEMFDSVNGDEVAIPDYITVHLGSPNDNLAENYRLPFIDYVKNVATHEIYSTWEEAAIIANILAQMSFALNRIYTVWYPSKGNEFDITNNLQFDQQFVKNAPPNPKIGAIVDKIFTCFLRKQGRKEPFISSYCDGFNSKCDGLSQCGSQDLACKGYSTMDILRYYFRNDIQVAQSNNTGPVVGRYPGSPLRLANPITGQPSVGEDVLRMQVFLNRLSGNWYIDPIPSGKLNGIFGVETEKAVTMFQRTPPSLPDDGVIGPTTWYRITLKFTAAAQLAELTSEGIRIGIGSAPPTVSLQVTSDPETRGQYVVELQFLLNFIAQYYNSISPVIQNGVYRNDTKRGVQEFQKEFELDVDGKVDKTTWAMLYEVYYNLYNNYIPPAPPELPPALPPDTDRPFPGLLKVGSQGEDVRFMQNCLNAIALVYTSISTLVPDGKFGPLMEKSVKEFQNLFYLKDDGQIGPLTWDKIIEVYNSLTDSIPNFPGDLSTGSSGTEVSFMQQYLNAIGYVFPVIPTLTVDGKFGPASAAAVKAFQSLFGLTATGIIDRDTWNKIIYVYNTMPDVVSPGFPGTTLSARNNSRGSDVLLMQKYLNAISDSYPSIPSIQADGIFGPGTEQAVRAFQNQFGLGVDGAIGRGTWPMIVSIYNLTLMYSQSEFMPLVRSTNLTGRTQSNALDKYALMMMLMMSGRIR